MAEEKKTIEPQARYSDEELQEFKAIILDMLAKAKKHVEEHTYVATNREEFEKLFAEKSGFVKAMWCGERACEEEIKDKMGVSSRCMPFHQECLSETCAYCGKPAKKMVYWGRAY